MPDRRTLWQAARTRVMSLSPISQARAARRLGYGLCSVWPDLGRVPAACKTWHASSQGHREKQPDPGEHNGLDNRGSMEVGKRADLVRVETSAMPSWQQYFGEKVFA